ncbi:dihydrolipoyl dehydrogenase [Pontivivens insulae]|uniref:Dihydrolipoyl dehydrogenase n=1 Tax=Pontivivens insulae TaxID=1639689 RepID=A0A2R8AEK3_9RHOB|nr:dihydrolipoyl dehydrogenase [Pontivivens insulae]RED11771.1 dihydrolipoamide dehydrogenase [Pontivivens insulae]SPF30528.1 Dihydrolipoyl dehydrogenase 3 [Pontivivens insulae]
MADYDVIVIGAGPGGYVCAIRCAQLGLKTACVEGRETLGGTCLNVGCIPSKAMLHASELYHEATENFAKMGLMGKSPSVDLPKMLEYKQSSVDSNTSGIEFLFKKNKVDWLKGYGSIPEAGKVKVGDKVHTAKNIVIATGSEAASLPGVEVDEKVVVTSTGALELKKVPGKMVVIGGGVIGLELGSVYSRLGSEVTVVEFQDHIIPGSDGEISKQFLKMLKKQGLKFELNAAVQGTSVKNGKATVTYKKRKDDSEHTLDADVVLLATGRRPYTSGLGLEELGVEMERGMVKTDAHWSSNIKGIYAIGDVISGPMLAHKAEDEGMAVAETIAGQHGHVNYSVIPGVIYTHPEVANVGQTEEQLKAEGRKYKVGKFPFMGNARAKSHFAGEGFVKILADAETDRILGAHLIGPMAGDLIHEVCVAMEFGAAAEDLARTCHAHPTFSEAMREAALACGDGAIHA